MEVSGRRAEACGLCLIEGFSPQAIRYCNKCDEHMCNKCFQHHIKLKICRNHVLSPLWQSVFPEPSDWDHFLKLIDCDENIATESLTKQSFPSKTQLNKLQQKYLENKSKFISDLLKIIEDRICRCVKRSHKNIQNTWLGYTIDQSGNVNVELIIEMDGSKDDIKLDIEYDHKMIQVHVFSPEARFVMEQSEKVDDLSYREINEMRKCINENVGKLMEQHKHLTIINASPIRSKGFCCMKHKLIPEKCLVFYVRKKGYIPIGEEPFESEYDGFPIDVREGAFYTSMIAGSDSELKMGCKIAKKVASFTDQDRYQYGTLGGFIEHPQYGLCGLTCAHVLLDDVEMARLQDLGELTWLDFNSNVDVYLYRDTHIKIGRLVKAILTRGDERSHGIDAAIFQIENLYPTHGLFVNEISEAAHFDSGKVYGPSRFSSELNVFKYGSTTGKTSGVFLNRMPVIMVKTQADQFPANLVMYNQIEIKGVNNIAFSEKGDSGSLVMIDDQNGERFCVGVVEGGTSYGSTVVTPVCPVLEKLNVTSLKCFESDQIKDTVRRLERSLVQTNDKIEETKNEILTAVRTLRQPDQYRFQCLIL